MPIIDLTPEHEALYWQCLEDWSTDMAEAGPRREIWYRTMLSKGLRVKLALTEEGVIAGFIQYLPVRESTLIGEDGYFICCIWVHGHKAGRGNLQKKGLGKALLQAAEEDVKALDGKGMAAWGLMIPIWMKAAWFKKYGYRKIDRDGIAALMWKPFSPDAKAPAWRRQLKKPLPGGDKLRISIFGKGNPDERGMGHYLARILGWIITFNFVSFTWIFFRARGFAAAGTIIGRIIYDFNAPIFWQWISGYSLVAILIAYGYLIHFIPHGVDRSFDRLLKRTPLVFQSLLLAIVIWVLFQARSADIQPFIYFQF